MTGPEEVILVCVCFLFPEYFTVRLFFLIKRIPQSQFRSLVVVSSPFLIKAIIPHSPKIRLRTSVGVTDFIAALANCRRLRVLCSVGPSITLGGAAKQPATP